MIPTTHDREAPTANQGPSNVNGDTSHEYTPTVPTQTRDARVTGLDAYIAHFQLRSIQAAIADASAQQRRRRAEEFLAARHRPGIDWAGRAGQDELRARWVALTGIAAALNASATLAPIQDLTPELIELLEAS